MSTTATREETISKLKEQIAAPEKETEDKGTREYVVLMDAGEDMFKKVASVEAGSVEAAIKALGGQLTNGSKYIAVPARSWRPQEIAIQTTTTVSFK